MAGNLPPGTKWAVGTELNLVRRLANAHPDKQIVFLDKSVCYCSTMNRIDLPHLVWTLESLVAGKPVNRITVAPDIEAEYRALHAIRQPCFDPSPKGRPRRPLQGLKGCRPGRPGRTGRPPSWL